jgi:hypothetical protein
MPAGRPGISGGHAWARPLSHAVSVRSLRRRAKGGTQPLNAQEVREYRRLLRKLVAIYRIACVTPQPTSTERRRTLGKIKTAAERFLKTSRQLWADKLLDHLDSADVNTRSILNREIISHGHKSNALVAMKRELRGLFSPSVYPDEIGLAPGVVSRAMKDRAESFWIGGRSVVQVLANIEIEALVPGSGRWPDPPLANLVAGLEPIWCRVTGRTAALVSDDKELDTTKCPFAEWLGDLLESIGRQRLPVGRVVDIVRSKIEKSGTPDQRNIGG